VTEDEDVGLCVFVLYCDLLGDDACSLDYIQYICVIVFCVLFGRTVEGGDSGTIEYSPKIWLQGPSRNASKVS
jgi:hypothetical protein